MINFNNAFDACLACALWSSGNNYTIENINTKTFFELKKEFAEFCNEIVDRDLDCHPDYVSDEHLGHDFWLTRNGHGAGFWDGDWGDIGDELAIIAKAYGSVDLIAIDSGELTI